MIGWWLQRKPLSNFYDEQIIALRTARATALAEDDEAHASVLECRIQAVESLKLKHRRWDREQDAGVKEIGSEW